MQKNSKIIIAFVLAVLIMGHSFTSYAADGGSNGVLIYDYYTIPSDSSFPVLDRETLFNNYGSFTNHEVAALPASGSFFNATGTWSQATLHSVISNTLKFNTVEYSGSQYDTNTYSIAITPLSTSNTSGYIYMMFGSETQVVLVGGYAVSLSPITYVCGYYSNNDIVQFSPFDPLVTVVNTPSDNGFYCVEYKKGNDYPTPVFSTLPMYSWSSDGASGFTNFSTTTTDFDFDDIDTYFNFNVLMTGEYIIDPNAPEIEPDSPTAEKYNLKFDVNSYYAGVGFNKFYHNLRFRWNEYTVSHPDQYWLNSKYYVVYQDDQMQSPVTLYFGGSSDFTISDNLLGLSYRMGNNGIVPTTWSYGIPSSSFSFDNKTLEYYLKRTVNTVTGTSVEYADPDSMLETDIIDSATTNVLNWVFGNPMKSIVPVFGAHITQFVVHGETWLSNQDPMNVLNSNTFFESFSYYSTYDFLTGLSSVGNNSYNDKEPYFTDEITVEDSNTPLTQNTGSGGYSYNAPVAYGYGGSVGNITINSGEQYKYTISAGSVEAYNGMIDGIKEEMAGLSDNNFFQIMGRTLGFIPDAFWYYLAIGSGVIVFSAIVRFVLRR